MSLIAISSLESASRKFFTEPDVHHSLECRNQAFLGLGGENESNSHSARSESARRKFFMNSTQYMCKNLESDVFGLRRPK